jgi:hypothetical protein
MNRDLDKHPQFHEMTMRKTGRASKILELRSFYKVWVTSVFAEKRFFMSFSTLVVKYHRGFALKLSQPSCLPHGTESHHGKKDASEILIPIDPILRFR